MTPYLVLYNQKQTFWLYPSVVLSATNYCDEPDTNILPWTLLFKDKERSEILDWVKELHMCIF